MRRSGAVTRTREKTRADFIRLEGRFRVKDKPTAMRRIECRRVRAESPQYDSLGQASSASAGQVMEL